MIQKIGEYQRAPATGNAVAWNRLLSVSADLMPVSRRECLDRIADHFYSGKLVTSSVIEGGDLVAAMPLVPARFAKVFRSLQSVNNPWLQAGGLLTDKGRVTTKTFEKLASQLREMHASFIDLEWVYDSIEIQRLMDALKQAGSVVYRQARFETGTIELTGTWDEYLAGRSRGFRKKIRRRLSQLRESGEVRFERHTEFPNRQILGELLDVAFEIEHRSWKGSEGSSLDSHPSTRQLVVDVLGEIAEAGELEIQFLTVDHERIAFEVGFRAHGVYYSYKVGYDPASARYSPGQLLLCLQLQHFFETGEVQSVDTIGCLSPASAKWCNQRKTRYRFLISTGGPVSNAVLRVLKFSKPLVKRILDHRRSAPSTR